MSFAGPAARQKEHGVGGMGQSVSSTGNAGRLLDGELGDGGVGGVGGGHSLCAWIIRLSPIKQPMSFTLFYELKT